MWPRGRHSQVQYLGVGRGVSRPNPTVDYPLTLGFNLCPQPQQGAMRGHQNLNYNNRDAKRDRIRPRHQGYSYYSDESLNSNYSGNTAGLRGGHLQGGSGITNAAMRNLPSKPPINDKRNNNNRGKDRVPSNAEGIKSEKRERVNQQSKENQSRNRPRQESEGATQHRMYFCPKCGENYTFRQTQNKYIGKIPLVLHCSHTLCQECAYQNLKNYKVNCPTCQTDSVLTQEETPVCQSDMQYVFPPNFYIFGYISYYRPYGSYLNNLDNIKLVSTSKKQRPSLPEPSERCCFGACTKEATMYCPSCEGIYCVDCCTVIHKSTNKLMSHEPVRRRRQKFSLMLENCGEHPNMQVEFFCNSCDLTACCYCVLEKHTDHERIPLYHLNETEMEEFKILKKNAEKALREVLYTQKKTARLTNFNTGSVKKDVCQYFADCHAKIENLENKLCEEVDNFKGSNRGLDGIQSSLTSSAEQLKQFVSFNVDKIGDKKLNLRGALQKLRSIDDIPRFLLNENGSSEPVRFVVNTDVIDALDNDLVIEKCEDSKYRLVTSKDLPEDYCLEIDEGDSEVEGNISAMLNQDNPSDTMSLSNETEKLKMVVASSANSVSSRKVQKHTKPSQNTKKKLEMERVDVQHINSMDSFFIQYKNNQSKLVHLNKDIENYVKMGGAQPVEEPQLNDLYLTLYVTESQNQKEQRWCRARLVDIKSGKNGPLYEMFFIDYGKTQTVDGSRIKDLPPFLAQKKPFAIECMLHNPMTVNWNSKAHLSLAKILNGKDVYMMVKAINSGVHEVDLMIASSDGGVTSVTDILVHATNSVGPINEDNVSLDGSISLRKEGYFPTLRVFPNSKSFQKNQKEKVVIANVVDPENIFVHLVQHQETFKNMNHSIKKAYKNSKSHGCIPIEGTYVLVEHRDVIRSNFHRAFIKSVDLNSDQVHVLLVDWGINVMVSTSNIRPLQECFTKLESQAILVKLAHIAPYNTQATWSPHATSFLQTYHRSQDVLKMVVHETDPMVQVALFDISGNVDLCLNALMVDNNLADSTGPVSTKLEWPQFEVKNPAFSEEEGLLASMLKKAHEEAYDSEDDDLKDVKKRQVDVVKVEAPDLIWIKFLEFRERESLMFKELQIHYSQEQTTKPKWDIDDQCVVEVKHEFARGKILEEINGQYKVYLYDKVREITTTIDKIYVYNMYFMKYPQAVLRSHLAYIKPAGDTGKWSHSSIEALKEIFSKHKRIYGNKAPESDTELEKKSLPLDMWYGLVIQGGPLDPDRLKYVSINNFLVKLGFAYKVPRPLTPKPSSSKTLLDSISKPSTSQTSPVKTARSGDDLLKILTGESIESEEKEKNDLTPAIISEPNRSADVKSGAEVQLKSSKKDKKNKKRSPRKERPEKTQCMKILESLNKLEVKPSIAREKNVIPKKTAEPADRQTSTPAKESMNKQSEEQATKTKKTEEKDDIKTQSEKELKSIDNDDQIKNWSAIVDEELGEPFVKPKTLQGLDDSGAEDEPQDSPYHKSEVVIDDWLPAFRLTKKDFQARVTCVETNGHLYLHEEAMDNVYYKMEANIKEYFDKNPPEISNHKWEPGHLCTIKYSDGNWYRGKILKVKNPSEISVFMIDFGSDHDLSPDDLFREVLYTDIGSFATKVRLDKVYPKSGSWLSSDYDKFHELVTDWSRIVVNGPLDVDLPLVEVYNEKGEFVNQKLLELCPNLTRNPNFLLQQDVEEEDTVVIESIESEEPFADEMLMDNLNEELDTKKTHLPKLSPSKAKKNLKYKSLPMPEELLDGKKVLMEIGGIINHDRVALKTPGDVSDETNQLIVEIQDSVDNLPILKDIKIGMPCLAPYSEDGVWYRAQITGTQAVDLGFVDVLFVDYGNSEAVSIKNLREITSDYLKVPQQTWKAEINIALGDADGISVMQLMNSLERKQKYIRLVKKEPFTVDIYEKDGQLSYQTLIYNGSIKRLHSDEESV